MKHKCEYCGSELSDENELRQHIRVEHQNLPRDDAPAKEPEVRKTKGDRRG